MFKNTVYVMMPTSLVSGLGALDLRVSWGEPGNGPAGMGVGDVVGVLEAVRGGATAAAAVDSAGVFDGRMEEICIRPFKYQWLANSCHLSQNFQDSFHVSAGLRDFLSPTPALTPDN